METSLNLALPKLSLAAQKICVAQNLGGAAAPLAPPAPTPIIERLWKIEAKDSFPPLSRHKEVM